MQYIFLDVIMACFESSFPFMIDLSPELHPSLDDYLVKLQISEHPSFDFPSFLGLPLSNWTPILDIKMQHYKLQQVIMFQIEPLFWKITKISLKSHSTLLVLVYIS